jgi:hypothetical protein
MANADPQPWAPDPDVAPGTRPVGGTGGEKGTSSFEGNSAYNADGTPVSQTAPARGPASGVSYYASSNPTAIDSAGSTISVREDATSS